MSAILVIKLAALGDMVLAFAAMARIRRAHPQDHITLLTTPPYAALAQASGLFDRIETDGRPKSWRGQLALIRRLRRARYDRVYDLQTSSRSSSLYYTLWPRLPDWSGIARGARLRHANPHRDQMHTLERQADQLMAAGIWPDAPITPGTAPPPDLQFMLASVDLRLSPKSFSLEGPFALLIPGASPHRPQKRWPADRYGLLAQKLAGQGMAVAVIGGAGEAALAQQIKAVAHDVIDLTGKTDIAQVAALGARASLAVGNDTGPTHLIAAAGAPTVVVFSGDSDPALCAPRGRRVCVLQRPLLSDLDVNTVLDAVASVSAP